MMFSEISIGNAPQVYIPTLNLANISPENAQDTESSVVQTRLSSTRSKKPLKEKSQCRPESTPYRKDDKDDEDEQNDSGHRQFGYSRDTNSATDLDLGNAKGEDDLYGSETGPAKEQQVDDSGLRIETTDASQSKVLPQGDVKSKNLLPQPLDLSDTDTLSDSFNAIFGMGWSPPKPEKLEVGHSLQLDVSEELHTPLLPPTPADSDFVQNLGERIPHLFDLFEEDSSLLLEAPSAFNPGLALEPILVH
jgi:hypothetical protein